jgi:hypothetical protein
MSDCEKFTDLHTGKSHKYTEEAVKKLKAKYEAEGIKRVTFFKQYCVLGQIGEYKNYLKEHGLAPAKKVVKKSPPKKIAVAKKTPTKAAKKTPVKAAKKSPPKKIVVAKKSPVKAAKKTPAKAAKKTPPKKIAVTCLDTPCPDDKLCRVKTGNCVAKKTAGEEVITTKKGRKFLVATESQKKKVASVLSSKVKSPPKKIAVTCLDKPCPDDKLCRVKTGNCVAKKTGDEKVAMRGGRKYLYTTESQRAKIGSGSSAMRSAASIRKALTSSALERREELARAESDEDSMLRREGMFYSARDISDEGDETTEEDDETTEEGGDETSEEGDETSEDATTLTASEQARLNTQKDKILSILQKCKQD